MPQGNAGSIDFRTLIETAFRRRCLHLFPSIHFDISPLSQKHSSGTALDPGELLREGHLLRCRQPIHVGYRFQLVLRLDPVDRPTRFEDIASPEDLWFLGVLALTAFGITK